jgi:aldose 1-epimerase
MTVKPQKLFWLLPLCLSSGAMAAATTVTTQRFGQLPDGTPVDLYTLKSSALEVSITNFGGRIVTLKTADRHGKIDDVVLGYDSLGPYLTGRPFFGAVVGRYANRIAHGRFTLDGQTYQLPINNNGNSLHGGLVGFDKRLWRGRVVPGGVLLTYLSKDGEEGYPGNLTATVRYTVLRNELRVDYGATTDRDTVVNLSNHSYFNLAGAGNGDILGQELTIQADRYTPLDMMQIPTGELRSVAGTPFDFRKPHAIGERIDGDDDNLKLGHGYDENWVLNARRAGRPTLAVTAYDPGSGRVMEVLTDQPGVQLFSGNFLGPVTGKGGRQYAARMAFCLETQHFPDSPNHPDFPSTVLKPGKPFKTTTLFRFSTR